MTFAPHESPPTGSAVTTATRLRPQLRLEELALTARKAKFWIAVFAPQHEFPRLNVKLSLDHPKVWEVPRGLTVKSGDRPVPLARFSGQATWHHRVRAV